MKTLTAVYRILLLALLSSFLLAGCGSPADSAKKPSDSVEPKILNGVDLEPVLFPQIHKLTLVGAAGEESSCSAVAVGLFSVITAAHCLEGDPLIYLNLGEARVIAESQSIAPGYRIEPLVGAIFNDLAVVRFKLENPFLALPVIASTELTPGSDLFIYGYGLSEDGSSGLLKGGVTRVDLVTQNHIFGPEFFGEGSNTCSGDSGGPAIVTVQIDPLNSVTGVVGVTSSGTVEGCQNGDRTLYTNLQNPALISFLATEVPEIAFR